MMLLSPPAARRRTNRHYFPVDVASGFTLVELLIAVALMGIISVMCWRGLDGVLRSRDWLTVQSDDLKAMTLGYSQMEDDLRRSWMTRQMKVSARTIVFTSSNEQTNAIALNLLRDGSQFAPGQIQQVSYRVNNGQLERGFTPWALPDPTVTVLRNDPANMTWQVLVANVQEIAWRVFVPGKGWLEAKSLTDVAAANQLIPAGTSILGVELVLKRPGDVIVTRNFTVRD